jgi:hypothetical protein
MCPILSTAAKLLYGLSLYPPESVFGGSIMAKIP